jgi:hypothetical protein
VFGPTGPRFDFKKKSEPVKREEVVISALPAGWEAFARKMVDEKAKGDWNAPCVICSRGANGEFPPFNPHPTNKCGFLWTLTKAGLDWLEKKRGKKLTQGVLNSMIGVSSWNSESLMGQLQATVGQSDEEDCINTVAQLGDFTLDDLLQCDVCA